MLEIQNIIKECRKPFTPEAIKFKIQTSSPKGARVVTYIDARHVGERLNSIAPDMWRDSYKLLTADDGSLHGVECTIILGHGAENISRSDVGTGEPDPRMGGIKILYSDAFKRAAVKFGIGAFLYAQPMQFVPAEYLGKNNKDKFYLKDQTIKTLQGKYAKWLEDTGIKIFGEPLDHGDSLESQGDIEIVET